MAPAVVVVACAVVARIFWHWRDGPYREAILAAIREREETATSIAGLVTGVIGFVGIGIVTTFVSAHFNIAPCLCSPRHALQFLLSSSVTAGIISSLENAALFSVVFAITKMVYGARR
jgi:hypothetical protein